MQRRLTGQSRTAPTQGATQAQPGPGLLLCMSAGLALTASQGWRLCGDVPLKRSSSARGCAASPSAG